MAAKDRPNEGKRVVCLYEEGNPDAWISIDKEHTVPVQP